MLATVLSFSLMVIFLFISFLHMYWVLGGEWATDRVFPDELGTLFKDDGMSLFAMIATVLVAIAFLVAAYLVAANNGRVISFLSASVIRYLLITLAIVFFMRSIGDFKYCGFFKSKKEGLFAYWDSRLYSPLCLGLAVALGVLLFVA